jgi:hypothetical protein
LPGCLRSLSSNYRAKIPGSSWAVGNTEKTAGSR